MAKHKKDALIKIWPLESGVLTSCVKESSRSYCGLTQADVDALLQSLSEENI